MTNSRRVHWHRWLWPLTWALLLALSVQAARAQGGGRVALVIGNAAYEDAPLKNPVNDALALSATLKRLGFQVTTLTNRNRADLTRAIRDFGRSAQGAEAALFYFAGHGVQVRGKNYLLPVGQRFSEEAEVETEAVDVNAVLARLEEAGARVSLLVLDACRSNPLQRRGRGGPRGLARMEAPSGALVAFAAQPGAEAQDGSGANGVYTKNLLKHIETPGLTVEQVFRRVRADVEQETSRVQSPREESSLTGTDFFFVNPYGRVNAQDAQRMEDEAWALCRSAATAGPCQAYLDDYGQGRYARLARTRLADLQPRQTSVQQSLPAGQVFRDCPDCPEMVVIPAGSFQMGSPASEPNRFEDEGPQRRVTLRSFALGKTEVTQAQWKALMGNNPSAFTQCGDACPVEQVSWSDAQEFVRRLSAKTGKQYALPSEAQWEYAARAGTTTAFNTGAQIITAEARFGSPAPVKVGSFAANAFGLHDMHGNVGEWVQDCYDAEAYAGKAPSDGSAYDKPSCASRVLRGGSWDSYARFLRAAGRFDSAPGKRHGSVGFRVCRVSPIE